MTLFKWSKLICSEGAQLKHNNDTAWAHMFWGYEKPAEKSQAQVFYFLWDVFYFLRYIVLFLSHFQVTAILAKYNGQFLQQWFCSVTSPHSFEAIHWSHPLQRAETELLWKFGVSTCSICKVILKFSSVTLLLQCPCWKSTIYHRFVHILSRYALFWWLVP